jgi:hypothetical protein
VSIKHLDIGISTALFVPVTLRIARRSEFGTTTISLSGRIRSEDLQEIRNQMEAPRTHVVFDMKEVTIVDLAAVRFLGLCEIDGARFVNCAPYIREWIMREKEHD